MKKEKSFWVTAAEIKKLTGWNNEQMRIARANNPSFWNQLSKKSYLYDANALPQSMIIKKLEPVS